MGVDSVLSLPPGTRVGDVAKVLGAAFGLDRGMHPFRDREGGFFEVPGAKVKVVENVPTMLWVILSGPGVDDPARLGVSLGIEMQAGEQILWRDRGAYWHYENDRAEVAGSPMVCAGSTPHWIAALRRAGEFFGGVLDRNDCDVSLADEVWPPVAEHRPYSNGDEWQRLQDDMAAVEPLTPDEVADARQWAAYRDR